jgi:serine/threonine-protein kinase
MQADVMNVSPPHGPPPLPGDANDPNDPARDGLPTRFGKYTLLRKLAVGGMAELFLALQKSVAGFEKLLVIKRILPAMNQDRGFIEMLLHEARIAATLTHANIVQIFDVGQVDGTYYIAMEHVHGEDLRGIVRQMRKKGVIEFPLEHAIEIMLGVTAGLSYAHEKRDLDGSPLNIVHRDISPQNVVVTFSGDVKIVDFGIAKSDTKMAMETQSGKLKGKVPYMSPEQARGEPLDARSDVFAVGVMLFELTTGRRLFKGQSEFETLKLICEREYPRPSQVHPGYPPELEGIVMKALSKDKTTRYQSARELQSALEDYVRRERIPVSNVALTQYMQSLFEEKLLAQKEQILQGKQLADIIDLQQPLETTLNDGDGVRLSSSVLSAPSAARTVTEIRPMKRTSPFAITMGAAFFTVAVVGAGIAWKAQQKTVVDATVVLPHSTPIPVNRGTITLGSDPVGASVWIDGEMRADVTPAQIAQLPTGRPIELKVSKEGFEAQKKTFTLTDAEPSARWDVQLSRGSVTLDLAVKPKPAGMIILLDGKPVDAAGLTGVTSGDQHKLVVGAPGYTDQAFTFIAAPQETKHFDVVLAKETHRPHPPVVQPANNNGGNNAVVPPPPPPPVLPAGNGKLNVGASNGWCNVSVDGVSRGPTPLAGLELTAGPHRVTCVPPDRPAMSANVTVPTDGTARYKFTLP